MKRKYHRVGFTAAQSAELWDRWRKGEALSVLVNLARPKFDGSGKTVPAAPNWTNWDSCTVLFRVEEELELPYLDSSARRS